MHKIRQASVAIFAAFALLSATLTGCAVFGLDPDTVQEASTPKAKFFAAKVEYGKLLVYANEYKASPTADEDVVETLKSIDLRVQELEVETERLLALGEDNAALRNIELIRAAILQLRAELIRQGLEGN